MTVIAASLAHVAVLEALHGQCFDDGWTSDDFGRLLASPGGSALILVDGAEPVGLAVIRVAADECELLTIGIIPEYRQRRFGRILLEASVVAARDQGGATYFLDVAEDNHAACRLYCSVGFTQVGRRPNYYRRAGAGVAALVMALDLHAHEQSTGAGPGLADKR